MPPSSPPAEDFLHNNNVNNNNNNNTRIFNNHITRDDLISSTLDYDSFNPSSLSSSSDYDYDPLGEDYLAGSAEGTPYYPNVTVIDNMTYCWDQNLQGYTWCQNEYQLYSVPLSKL